MDEDGVGLIWVQTEAEAISHHIRLVITYYKHDRPLVSVIELSTNLHEFSYCLEKAPTREFFSLIVDENRRGN